ncbi:MAG: protoporphyrinogen oxidase [Bdellovibrionales bacterium]|nr:protoporphyrinogen oxidase [Bdellovibrionales bacterium]
MPIKNKNTIRVGILGAGVSGLSTHYYLKKWCDENRLPVEISVIEKTQYVGGVIRTESKSGFILEHGPDCFLTEKLSALDFMDELGLRNELIPTKAQYRKSYILKRNMLYPVPEGLYLMAPGKLFPFLGSPLLSWKGKLRTLLEPFVPRRSSKTMFEDESLASFVKRRFGLEMLEQIAQPMIAGIYTADPNELSLQSTMPRFLEWEKNYGSVLKALLHHKPQKGTSGPRYSLFSSFIDGMATLTNKLAEFVPENNLFLNHTFNDLSWKQNKKQWNVETKTQSFDFDLLISCLPSYEIIPKLNRSHASENFSQTIDYASSAVLHFAFRTMALTKPFGGIGFVVPFKENKDIMACSFLSHKFQNRAPEGMTLVRVFCGGKLNEKQLDKTDSELTDRSLKELEAILGLTEQPLFSTVHRWTKRMPQYVIGHQKKIDSLNEYVHQLPAFYLCGNYFNGVGIPDVIAQAKMTSERVLSYLQKTMRS